jgi:hypothetical protein
VTAGAACAELEVWLSALRDEVARTMRSGHGGVVTAEIRIKRSSRSGTGRIESAVVKPAWIDALARLDREKESPLTRKG